MYRRPTVEEFAGIANTLSGKANSAELWKGRVKADTVVEGFKAGKFDAVIVEETYLLIYAVGSPWYSDEYIDFYEMGVYRIARHCATFVSVTQAMEGIARQCGASRILVGTSLPENKRALVRLYERYGFRAHAYAMIKEL